MVLAAVAAIATISAASGRITGAYGLTGVARLTGSPSLNDTKPVYDIGGTDLGIPIFHSNKTYFLFGDTFSGETPKSGGNWRRNTVAWSTDVTPSDGIVFDSWAINPSTGWAKQTFANDSPSGVITNIPTGGLSVNGRLYAWFMNVIQWGPADGEWYISQAELAKWNAFTSSFNLISNSTFSGSGNFGMVAAREGVNGDPYIYLWGTPAGRFGRVKLARFLPSQIENRASYQFYTGKVNGVPQWSSDEFAGVYVIDAQVGEMSVMYNEALAAWTILYFDEISDRIEIRQADEPWGPWSSPTTIMRAGQCPSGTSGPYAPYMLPQWTENGGRTLYFMLSLWVPYDVYMAKVSLNIDDPPSGSVSINAGAACTNSTSVTLSLPASADAAQMRISNDGVFDTESWQTYTATRAWNLTAGDGMKTVYVKFRDSSYNESCVYSDGIVLDRTPPVITLLSTAPTMAAEGSMVHLTVRVTDPAGVTSVYAETTVALAQTSSSIWEGDIIAGGIGAHSVAIEATDAAGNCASYHTTGYTTAPVVAASPKSLSDHIMVAASERYLFKVCGRAMQLGVDGFDVSDGSGTIHVLCEGYEGIEAGDYVVVTGMLTPGGTPVLTAQPDQVQQMVP